jgi:hypothetical protein
MQLNWAATDLVGFSSSLKTISSVVDTRTEAAVLQSQPETTYEVRHPSTLIEHFTWPTTIITFLMLQLANMIMYYTLHIKHFFGLVLMSIQNKSALAKYLSIVNPNRATIIIIMFLVVSAFRGARWRPMLARWLVHRGYKSRRPRLVFGWVTTREDCAL